MTVGELQELLKNKRSSMQVVIATYDENNVQRLFDLKGEDSFIRGGAPTFYFLEARNEEENGSTIGYGIHDEMYSKINVRNNCDSIIKVTRGK